MTPKLRIFLDLLPHDLKSLLEPHDGLTLYEQDDVVHIVCKTLRLADTMEQFNIHWFSPTADRLGLSVSVESEEILQDTYDLLEILKKYEICSIELTISCTNSADASNLWHEQEKIFRAVKPPGKRPEMGEPSLVINVNKSPYAKSRY